MNPTRRQLGTTNAEGHRIRLFPAQVSGRFATWRAWLHPVLVLLFLGAPWIHIRGLPLLQLDIIKRRFYIGGHLFLAQDAPSLVFVFASFALAAALVTALWGRAWCGWACPQTVFIDFYFRRIERLIEGDHIQQRQLARAPWSLSKALRFGLKWTLFLLGALILSHSFVAYFAGPADLSKMMRSSPLVNPGFFALMALVTSVVLFDFAWFREQFCLIICPYGRLQSILMDEASLTVAYDTQRGEPRAKATSSKAHGDCVDCFRCVQVCPTGIDIRNGLQMECIACTACIDACDAIMDKLERPRGLIRYESELGFKPGSKKSKQRYFRGRVLFYSVLLLIMATGLTISLRHQESFESEILRATDTPYQIIPVPGLVINHFTLNAFDRVPGSSHLEIRMAAASKAQGIELVAPQTSFQVEFAENFSTQFFVKFPRPNLSPEGQASALIELQWLSPQGQRILQTKELHLVGPGSKL